MNTTAVFFPFDLFGSAGASAGADLLFDAFREMLADNRRETAPSRAQAYTPHVKTRRLQLDTMAGYQDWRPRARRVIRQALRKGEFLLWITGNHLGALPIYDEVAIHAADTHIVQFDAHLDIHQFADCTRELSHGNFLRFCEGKLPPIINVGHRELLLTTAEIEQFYQHIISAEALARDPDGVVKSIKNKLDGASRVFIDIDCDVFDAAYFPAVSNPLPFGLSPMLLLRLLNAVWSERVAGVSISEFDPGRDQRDQSLGTLMWLLEYLLLRRYETKPSASDLS